MAGIYTLNVVDANNCTSLLTFEIQLSVPVTAYNWKNDIRLFPNPLALGEILHIQLPNPNPVSMYRIFDAQGRLLQSSSVHQQELSIRFPDAGIYWIQLLDESAKSARWRLLVF